MIAARNLIRAGKKVVVLEARDRVGGRVKAGKIAGRTVDVGGMWVGPTQTRMLDLIKEYGFHTTPQFEGGKQVVQLAGKRWVETAKISVLDPPCRKNWTKSSRKWMLWLPRCRSMPPGPPRGQKEFDAITVENWISAQTKNDIVRSVCGARSAIFSSRNRTRCHSSISFSTFDPEISSKLCWASKTRRKHSS